MNIGSNTNQISNKQLYQRFINGDRPEYNYDLESDKPIQELNILAEKYKQSKSLNDKKILLEKEREILYQELNHPELTLARNYKNISNLIPQNITKESTKNLINNFNLCALIRIESMGTPFESKYSKHKIQSLNKIYDRTNAKALYGMENKTQIDNIIDWVEFYNTKNESNKTPEPIKSIKTLEEFEDALLFGTKSDYPIIYRKINKVLKNEKANPEYKHLAVWGAGKYRSDVFFNKLKEIALNKSEKDIKLRELAIHSTALYIKERPEEVKTIMSTIEKDKTIFSPLAKIINQKINGEYNKEHKELKGLTQKERKQYLSLKKRYIKSDSNINIHSQNAIDKALLFYKKILGHFVNNGNKCIITNDTYTKIKTNSTGKRCFTNGLFNSGDFYDSFTGINTTKDILVNKKKFNSYTNTSVLGHECAHALNRLFTIKDWDKLKKLYSNALNEGNILDNYGKRNFLEYFAQGCEAYISEYKPHSVLLKNHGSTNTRYDLLIKDPELFKFIKYCIKKYH